jgi:hypothetical protein
LDLDELVQFCNGGASHEGNRMLEAALEKGHGDYNLIGVWCGNVFILGGPPLKDGMGRENMAVD